MAVASYLTAKRESGINLLICLFPQITNFSFNVLPEQPPLFWEVFPHQIILLWTLLVCAQEHCQVETGKGLPQTVQTMTVGRGVHTLLAKLYSLTI